MRPWYESAVFYHLYPLGATGAPFENRGPAESRFDQLDAWIPYLEDLGFSALYIGPLFESSTHGYDTRDLRLVDRRLGTNGEFRDFVDACHRAGIRVVIDAVFNHTGREFFAFRDIQERRWDSPYRDWYRGVSFQGQSPMGDPFCYDAWQGQFNLPCLNLKNPEVKNYLLDTVRFWADTFDIDGLRLDCANVLDFDFMRELRAAAPSVKEDFWLMGEVIHGEYDRWVRDDMLHSVTNYALHKAFWSAHNDRNYFEIAHTIRRLPESGIRLYTFADNHDEDRLTSKLTNPAHLAPLYTLLFSLPGIPSIYYGSEWGIQGKRTPYSDHVLRPAVTAGEAREKANELTALIRRLIRIHRENPEFHFGRYQELSLTNRQFAFARLGEESMAVTAVNCDDAPCSFSLALPAGVSRAVSLLAGTKTDLTDGVLTFTLEANSGEIFRVWDGPDEAGAGDTAPESGASTAGRPADGADADEAAAGAEPIKYTTGE